METMKKGMDVSKELGEGSLLYYLAYKFNIRMPNETIYPILNERNSVKF